MTNSCPDRSFGGLISVLNPKGIGINRNYLIVKDSSNTGLFSFAVSVPSEKHFVFLSQYRKLGLLRPSIVKDFRPFEVPLQDTTTHNAPLGRLGAEVVRV